MCVLTVDSKFKFWSSWQDSLYLEKLTHLNISCWSCSIKRLEFKKNFYKCILWTIIIIAIHFIFWIYCYKMLNCPLKMFVTISVMFPYFMFNDGFHLYFIGLFFPSNFFLFSRRFWFCIFKKKFISVGNFLWHISIYLLGFLFGLLTFLSFCPSPQVL